MQTDPARVKVKVPKVKPKGMLDVLPTKAGGQPKVYRPPVVKPVVAQADQQRRVRQSQVKDTKGNADRARGRGQVITHGPLVLVRAPGSGLGGPNYKVVAPDGSTHPMTVGDYRKMHPTKAMQMRAALGPTEGGKFSLGKLGKNFARDAIDIPANTIPSLYHIGDEAVSGHPVKATKDLVKPIVDTIEHPAKSFKEHPLGTLAIGHGIKGTVGRLSGRVMRAAPSKTLNNLASTEGRSASVPTTKLNETRPYSKDVIHKYEQKAYDSLRKRSSHRTMSEQEIARRVDEAHHAAQQIARQNAARVQREAEHAIKGTTKPTGGLRSRSATIRTNRQVKAKPTAAVSLAAQGIALPTYTDIHAYLIELEHAAKSLTGDELKANERTQQQLHDALTHHDPVSAHNAATAYQQHRAVLEQQAVKAGLVKPDQAEAARFAPTAARRLGVSGEAKRVAKVATKDARVKAESVKKQATKQAGVAERDLQKAHADARVAAIARKTSPELKAAEGARDTVVRNLARLRKQKRGGDRPLTYTAQVKTARMRVRSAQQRVTAERSRLSGVPTEAPPAVVFRKVGVDDMGRVIRKRVRVGAPKQIVDDFGNVVERGGGRVPRSPADRLISAGVARTETKAALAKARVASKQAIAANRAVKKAPYVNAKGEPVSIADARATLPAGSEPAFVSHTPVPPRTAALPLRKPSIPVKDQRGGEAVTRGTLNVSPGQLVNQSVHTQRLLDATDAHRQLINDMGHRATPGGSVTDFSTEKVAQNTARDLKQSTGVEWQPVGHPDGGFALIPKAAAKRAEQHAAAQTIIKHPLVRAAGGLWVRNVLSFSTKWLYGQAAEPALRAAVARAGVKSWLTANRVFAEAARRDPKLAEQLRANTIGGTLGSIPKRHDVVAAEDFADKRLQPLVKQLARLRQTHGPKELVDAYMGFTNLVLGTLNGAIQLPFQQAMLGRALRDSPLMDGHFRKLSKDAISAAVDGLEAHQTNAYAQLGRAVDDMLGKYGKFSPDLQLAVVNYTPFIAWTLSAFRLLGVVLPRDHPTTVALLASANQASENWRKQHGLYLDPFGEVSGQAPFWLQGSLPGKNGSHITGFNYAWPGSVTTGSGGGPLGALTEAVFPQIGGASQALGFGTDWKGTPLAGRNGSDVTMARRNAAAIASLMTEFMPAGSKLVQITGLRTPDMPDNHKIQGNPGSRAVKGFNPFGSIPNNDNTTNNTGSGVRVVPVKVKPVRIKPVKIKPIKVR